ncbi:hypothetical protein JA1_000878 [Spathaspora sp. JA1]|nr:hypothetical protein JA1_000878 [Spathaspora sp. JA1]
MESPEIDRKSRLAELRRKRNQSTQPKPTPEQPIEPIQSQPEAKTETTTTTSEPETHITEAPPTLQLSNGETVEAVSQRIQNEIFQRAQYAASAVIDQNEEDEDENNTQQKISYTQDLKDDLKSYYHKASIRTDRAINRIISDKYQQTS